MNTPRRVSKDLLTSELQVELDSKLSSGDPIQWDDIVGRPQFADDSWKSPVATIGDLPATGNEEGDLRLVLTDGGVYRYIGGAWDYIGANDTSVDWSQIPNKPTLFPPSAHTHPWTEITSKPTTFMPSAHTHTEAQITDLDKYTQAEVDAMFSSFESEVSTLLAGKANATHTHTEASITDLDKYTQAETNTLLAGKSDTGHVHTFASITSKPATYPPDVHTHAYADITGKPTTFAPSAHNHAWTEITSKPTLFPPSAHTHVEADITNLDKYTQAQVDTFLAGKANTSHTHTIANITSLQSALDAKVAIVAGKELSDNNFTDADKVKLDSLSDSASVDYATMQAELDAHEGDTTIHVTSTDKTNWDGHRLDSNIHVTSGDKTNWNGKVDTSTFTGHTGNTSVHVTSTEKSTWNAKAGSYTQPNTPSDLNTAITSGFYRLGGTHTNAPSVYAYGQMLVIRGGNDTITQIVVPYTGGTMYFRSGDPPEVGGGGTWRAWVGVWNNANFDPTTKANTSHTHAIADVTSLQAALDGKSATTHTHTFEFITDKPSTYPPSTHTHTIAQVTSLQSELDAKKFTVGTVQPTTGIWYNVIG